MPATKPPTIGRRQFEVGVALPWECLKYFRLWILAAVVTAALGPLAVSRYTSIEASVWSYTANVGEVFTAIIAGGFLYSLVPVLIANGLTRREFAVAIGVFGVLISLAISAIIVAGYFAEHAYYDLAGWAHGVDRGDGHVPLETYGAVADQALRYPLVVLMYFTGGAVIGAATYRWEGVGWLVSFPVAILVIALDDATFSSGALGPEWIQRITSFARDWNGGTVVVASVAAIAIGAAVAYRLMIDIPIRTKKA